MQPNRSDYDFDVISGPATRPAAPPKAAGSPAGPGPSGDAPAASAPAPRPSEDAEAA